MELKLIVFIVRGIAWILFGILLLILALLALNISPTLSGIITIAGLIAGIVGILIATPQQRDRAEDEVESVEE